MLNILLTIFVAIGLVINMWFLFICPFEPSKAMYTPFIGRTYAHRGLHSKKTGVPENSLTAFRKAIEQGYGIELDVRLSKDNKVIVIHDNNLLRMCGVDQDVDKLDYDELRTLMLNGSDEHIPLLSDVLSLVNGQVPLIIELKTCENKDTLISNVIEELDQYKGAYCIESFDPIILSRYKRLKPDIMRGQLAGNIRSDKYNKITKFLLSSLLINVISKPHFIAYRYEDMKNISYRIAVRVLRAYVAAWTIKSPEIFTQMTTKQCEMIIFEDFLPAPVIRYNKRN